MNNKVQHRYFIIFDYQSSQWLPQIENTADFAQHKKNARDQFIVCFPTCIQQNVSERSSILLYWR